MPEIPENASTSEQQLIDTVITGGYCIGCGACALKQENRFSIKESRNGFMTASPIFSGREKEKFPTLEFMNTCPHSGKGANETEIAKELFADEAEFNEIIGYWNKTAVLALSDCKDRLGGSSGGGVTWLLRTLLQKGLVDAIAHVKAVDPKTSDNRALFSYGISHSIDEINKGRKSIYYPVDISKVIDHIRVTPGRYAITTVPCYAKAVRNLMQQDQILRERIVFVIGLVCGHLKSRYYGEYLAWLAGVRPYELKEVDFRNKIRNHPAGSYSIKAASYGKEPRTSAPLDAYFGTSWELGFMKYKACEFCDDVFSETADVVFGDAWIDPYEKDWLGHNIVISRRTVISELIEEAACEGVIVTDEVPVAKVIQSQQGGVRHRREGLAWRLRKQDDAGVWRPRKRVDPASIMISSQRARVYERREHIRVLSSRSFALAKYIGSILVFHVIMALPVFMYYRMKFSFKRAFRESAPFKSLRRLVKRL